MINECKIPRSCDIFCNVIDNYGDIGVCWRLARQLVHEHGLAVRLWVDDLGSLAKLCHETDAARDIQHCRGVEVRRWTADAFHLPPQTLSRPAGHPLHEPLNYLRTSSLPCTRSVRGRGGEGAGLRKCFIPHPPPSQPSPASGGRSQSRTILRKLLLHPGSWYSIRAKNWRLRSLPLAGEGLGERGVADLVIEAFACKLPQVYIEAMAVQETKPVWINLEYLSAEDWVAGCHGLPSPHPNLPLTKYFFFPGFTPQTGGLLLECDLFVRRNAFWNDTTQQQAFWQALGMEIPGAETLKISLFGYENAALAGLFDVWANGAQPVLCLVPEGRILPQAGQYFDDATPRAGNSYMRGSLQVRVLPFVEQERYDELLWACDVNFVRGEDSCVRAQWAARPFVWQIYQQHDAVHLDKLQAFLKLYEAPLSAAASQAVQGLWQAWNSEGAAGDAWPDFAAVWNELERRTQSWARKLAVNNLALNLLDFYKKIGTMRAFKIEGQ